MVSEEVELIVESLLGVLLRTILEISNRPQPAGPAMRLQFQDVTVRVFYPPVCGAACAHERGARAYSRKLFWDLTKRARVIIDFKLSCCCGDYNSTNIININGNN